MPTDSSFTPHNVRLDDGTFTFSRVPPITQLGNYACVKGLLPLLFSSGWKGRSIVDLGCLEGGYATEFARLGLDATGIEIRRSNISNAEYIKSKTTLPNLRFICDDAWNVARYGPFDVVFCVGLHYHIEDQRRFLQEMGRTCRTAIFIDTHFAPEFDHEPAVALYKLSELTTHEGLPGRWYFEHDLEVTEASDDLEQMRWASWHNKRSFWPTKGGLLHAMRDAGFSTVMEDFDPIASGEVLHLSPEGWSYQNCRSMFVGIKAADAGERPRSEPPQHALDGTIRSLALRGGQPHDGADDEISPKRSEGSGAGASTICDSGARKMLRAVRDALRPTALRR